MSSVNKWFPWALAGVWLIIRIIGAKFFFENDYDKGRVLGTMSNLLLILLVIFVAIIQVYRKGSGTGRSFFSDVRQSMLASLKYVAGVVIAIGFYYSSLSEELENKRLNDYVQIEQALDTPEELARIKAENPLLKDLSKEQIIESSITRTDTFTSLRVILPSSLMALLAVSFIYSLLAAFLFRNFLRVR